MNRPFKNRWSINSQWDSYRKYKKTQKVTRQKLAELRKALRELKEYHEEKNRRMGDDGL